MHKIIGILQYILNHIYTTTDIYASAYVRMCVLYIPVPGLVGVPECQPLVQVLSFAYLVY